MKHIIIAGASRSGKTTLALKLAKHGFVHYKMDSIKRGIDDNFHEKMDDWREISPKMSHLIWRIIKDSETDQIKGKEFYVIDTCHVYPKDLYKKDMKDTIIIFLGYKDLDIYKKLEEMKKNDANYIWSKNQSDEDNLYNLELGVPYSKSVYEECLKYEIKYFDTSENFNEVIDEAYHYLLKKTNIEV